MTKYIDADRYCANLREMKTNEKNTVYEYYDDGIDLAISEAATFPAADIEPRWIPVTERLPEERGTYLVTVVDGTIKRAIAQWWYDVDNYKWYFVCDDCYAEDIVAWMLLPEPYKEGEQNESKD